MQTCLRTLSLLLALLFTNGVSAAPPLDGLPLPPPSAPRSRVSKIIGWKAGEHPTAPAGFSVTRLAEKLKSPRWIYADPVSNDLFVAESNSGRITLLRDKDGDGTYETRTNFITGLERPFGMTIVDGWFYVATPSAVWKYPYTKGQTKIAAPGTKIMSLPDGDQGHWTRNLLLSKNRTRLYVSVGSGSNDAESGLKKEIRRANILSVSLDGSDEKIVASGLRNPVGMDFASDGTLWTAVNERDNLGDDLVPDYITSVKDGGFYGWPFSYFGRYEDPRWKGQRPDLVAKAIVPDVTLGAHTASLGLAFYHSTAFPARYRGGAFVGQHGSWNRSALVGYGVKFVSFTADGKPAGPPEDFLTGFIADAKKAEVHGRPVGVTVTHDGSLLVVDDGADIIWKIRSVAKANGD